MNLSPAYGRPRPAGGWELRVWLFMRLSGILLLFLALGHLVLMHLIHNVDEINFVFVANRYAGWLWRAYDLALLLLAMIHGVSGSRILINDYIHRPVARRVAFGLLYGVCGALTILGTGVALFFRAEPMA